MIWIDDSFRPSRTYTFPVLRIKTCMVTLVVCCCCCCSFLLWFDFFLTQGNLSQHGLELWVRRALLKPGQDMRDVGLQPRLFHDKFKGIDQGGNQDNVGQRDMSHGRYHIIRRRRRRVIGGGGVLLRQMMVQYLQGLCKIHFGLGIPIKTNDTTLERGRIVLFPITHRI